jgi:1-acyl-sn-glycerol-3-phosphate acyltransferase
MTRVAQAAPAQAVSESARSGPLSVKRDLPEPHDPREVDEHRPRLTARLLARALAFTAKVLSGATARWIGCQPEKCQRVYFANHTSHLDAIVLWSALPTPLRALTRPVAAKDYWQRGPVRRYLANHVFNAILIDRVKIKIHQSPVDLLLRAIGEKYSLIVFPEGSRSTTGEVGPFKSGIYYLSRKRPDLELVPVYIENLNRVLPRGEFLPVPLLSSLTFGSPIWLESGESKDQFLRRARDAVLRLKEQ